MNSDSLSWRVLDRLNSTFWISEIYVILTSTDILKENEEVVLDNEERAFILAWHIEISDWFFNKWVAILMVVNSDLYVEDLSEEFEHFSEMS